MSRHFIHIDELMRSAETAAVLKCVVADARRAMEAHRHCDLPGLQTILDGMNAAGTDVADRFAYSDLLGGLVHIQLSHVQGEAFWRILPDNTIPGASYPVDRIAMNINGFRCTTAPADALASWRASPVRNDIVIAALGCSSRHCRRACASCGEAHNLKTCTQCKFVRYCGPACQRSHWHAHKPLCKWAKTVCGMNDDIQSSTQAIAAVCTSQARVQRALQLAAPLATRNTTSHEIEAMCYLGV